MSCHYLVEPSVPLDSFKERLLGKSWTINDEDVACDGTSYLHLHVAEGRVIGFWRFGAQPTVHSMIHTIREVCDVEVISEDDDRYWEIVLSDQ